MHLHFFSDAAAQSFYPLTLTRPIEELRLGILTIREKWMLALGSKSYSRQNSFVPGNGGQDPISAADEKIFWINSRYLPTDSLITAIKALAPSEGVFDGQVPIAVYSSNNNTLNAESATKKIPLDQSTDSIHYAWDMLALNGTEIKKDIERTQPGLINTQKYRDVIFQNSNQIFAEGEADIEPGAILLAGDGPIYLGRNVKIEAGAILRGPVAIGDHATVKMRARIYDGSTIGPYSKVGGEVANTLFHSYSNKAHDGFIGNSIFGQWCNLGADTNTSNLKNNYSPVSVMDWTTGDLVKTNLQFLGTIMGDHSKTSINTMLNTGTMCGVSSNIFSSSFPPKRIPSFTWLGDEGSQIYTFDKAVEAMKAMMGRRGISPSDDYIHLMEGIFKESH